MNPELKKELIMEHYTNPLNRGVIDDPRYIKVKSKAEIIILIQMFFFLLVKSEKIKSIIIMK